VTGEDVELKATIKVEVELDYIRLNTVKLNVGENNNSILVGVSVVELEGVVVRVKLDFAVEVVEVVAMLVGVDKGVVIIGVVVVETIVVEVYNIYVEVA
jgi:hypothetical protein